MHPQKWEPPSPCCDDKLKAEYASCGWVGAMVRVHVCMYVCIVFRQRHNSVENYSIKKRECHGWLKKVRELISIEVQIDKYRNIKMIKTRKIKKG